ncbi:hypothetical protein [Bacteroides sp. MSB163]|uniref:hypothetical protein n=1 Tax=Bacteroides maternus TaxID=3117552 RepID=UPI002ED842F3
MLHNKILRSGILFFAAIHISIVLNGQTAIQPVAPSVPTSPQAEAFKKYGDFEINYSTGIPDISIPLFEINHRGYKLPIILKYNPQPLRPGYNYDVYGHGWGLSVNSCISRTIEYLPDEWRDFKLETDKLSNSFEVYRRGGGITNINLGHDIFNAVLPDGSSFEFVVRRGTDGLEYIVSDSRSVQISCSHSSSNINSFTVIDEHGIKYIFDGADTPYRGIGAPSSVYYDSYVSWQLSSIQLPNSTEPIVFRYGLSMASKYKRYAKNAAVLLRYDLESPYTGKADAIENYQVYCYKMKLLTSIEYGSTSISLLYKNSAANAEYNYVDKVIIKDNGNLVRDIQLNKSIHTYSCAGDPDGAIAKLNSIVISGESVDSMVYECTYTANGGYFAGTDHWGYLNSSDVQYEIGNFNIFISFNYDFIRHAPVAITKLTKSAQELCPYEKIKLASRNYDPREPLGPDSHGVLRRLRYPTGGYTDFEFENHKFLTSTAATGDYIHDKSKRRAVKAGGFRIRRITNYTMEDSVADVKCYGYGEADNNHTHTGLGEAVVDPNMLTYANYTNGANFPLRYMLLGLSPTGKNEAFTHPYENGYPSQGIWGWECTFTVDNFRRILNGRTPVVYPEVTEYYGDIFTYPYSADNTTGKTVYKYDIYDILANDTLFFEAPQYYGNNLSYTPKKYRYNILKEKTDYVYENQSYRIIRQEINEWYKIYQGIQNYQYTNAYHTDHTPANASLYPFFTTKFYYLGSTLLTSRKVKTYAQKVYTDAYYYVTEKENYTYNVRGQLIEKILSGYKSGNIKTAYTYPVISTNGTTSAVIQDMVNKNIISPVLEERISSDLLSSSSSAFRNISGTKAEYGIFNVGSSTLYLPSKLYELNRFSISDYVLSNEVFSYSEQGNLREVVSKDGVHTVYLWSYKDRYLIAEIKNATSSQVSAAVSSVFGMTIDALSQVAVPDVTKLKSLRKNTNLKDAFVSTFTYQPLVGVTSMTDPSGMTTYYNYDGLGKLVETYYYEGNVVSSDKKRTLQQYEYHYRNQ